jgi:small subunit ribosomal protein S8e
VHVQESEKEEADKKKSNHVQRKLKARKDDAKVDPQLIDQFVVGRLYAVVSSRPGQSGRCDGYILEGKELEFYVRKLKTKRS